jgi:hypothetical protein
MKKFLLLLLTFLSFNSYSQDLPRFNPSTYYQQVDLNANINANVNVRQNVNVSGTVNVNKNITTIDYGALAQANAINERNRLERQLYANEEQKRIALEIASDPMNAFKYSQPINEKVDNSFKKKVKWTKRYSFVMTWPHSSLFTQVSSSGQYWVVLENRDAKGILVEINLSVPYELNNDEAKEFVDAYYPEYNKSIEELFKESNETVGKLVEDGSASGGDAFHHKNVIERTKIWGQNGFKQKYVWEDDYEYGITDNYRAFAGNKSFFFDAKVRYKGSKNDITFEDLEGRRFYLRRLIERYLASFKLQ